MTNKMEFEDFDGTANNAFDPQRLAYIKPTGMAEARKTRHHSRRHQASRRREAVCAACRGRPRARLHRCV